MVVGGASGSTAGGVKIPTFAVLIAVIVAHIEGHPSTSIFKRKISRPSVGRALAIFAAALVCIGVAAFILQITEKSGLPHNTTGWDFLDFLFEATSAFGTVGLSTGVTPALSPWGKVIAILLMFAGRVGPLTLGLALMSRRRAEPKFDYPEEDVVLG
jgi:trk system potassium uptake protein TrkH